MTNEEFIEKISLNGEEWRDVVGYEGLYIVSNAGRVASLPVGYRRGRVLKMPLSSHGYPSVCLTKDKHGKKIAVHRIVALAWIPNPNHYSQVDHIDGNRANPIVSNLRWCSLIMNQNYPLAKLNKSLSIRKDKSKSIEIVCLDDAGKLVKVYPKLMRVIEDGHLLQSVWKCLKGKKIHHHNYRWLYLSDYETSKSAMSKNS